MHKDPETSRLDGWPNEKSIQFEHFLTLTPGYLPYPSPYPGLGPVKISLTQQQCCWGNQRLALGLGSMQSTSYSIKRGKWEARESMKQSMSFNYASKSTRDACGMHPIGYATSQSECCSCGVTLQRAISGFSGWGGKPLQRSLDTAHERYWCDGDVALIDRFTREKRFYSGSFRHRECSRARLARHQRFQDDSPAES